MMAHNAFVSPAKLRAMLRGGEGRSAEPARCEVDRVHPGQAQAMTSARHGIASAVPGDSTASGTAASPSAARPLRRTFRGEPSQVPVARDFIRRYLNGCRCPADAVQDILVCITELAANAVLHSRSGLPGGHFSVEIAVRAGQWVRVRVEDSGGPWAERGTGDGDAECGRGLHVVSALSAGMGITGDASGRMAWFFCRWGAGEDDQSWATASAHVVAYRGGDQDNTKAADERDGER